MKNDIMYSFNSNGIPICMVIDLVEIINKQNK